MPMHIYHPPTGNDDDPIFHDGCEECERQSLFPHAYLDDSRMNELWRMMVEVEKTHERDSYRSQNEAVGARWCYNVAVFLERFTAIDPWTSLAGLNTLDSVPVNLRP